MDIYFYLKTLNGLALTCRLLKEIADLLPGKMMVLLKIKKRVEARFLIVDS